MTLVDNDVPRIRNNGWRQGSILPAALTLRLREENLLPEAAAEDLFLVLSHDCDVTHDSLAAEPYCEIVQARSITQERRDGNRFWGKSPRKYQFTDNSSGIDLCFEVSIHDVAKIPRTCLAEVAPDHVRSLTRENTHGICRWISRRYVRASFPDAFNERTGRVLNSFRRSLKSQGHLLESLYVLVSDDELAPGDDYNVIVWVTMRDELYDSPQNRIEAQKLVGETRNTACGLAVA